MKTSMLDARLAASCAVIGNKIYVIAGSNDGGSTVNSMEVYDIIADMWTTKTAPPVPNIEAIACSVNNKIYLIGGYNSITGEAMNNVQVYDPAIDMWTIKTDMPTSRSLITGAVINGKIYITGGWSGSYVVTEVYDPALDLWSTAANIPLGILQNNGGASLNGEFYCVGGRDINYSNPTIYDNNFRYNPITNSWSSLANIPTPLFSGSVVAYNGKIHHFGGATGLFTPNVNNHFIYDPTTDSWTIGQPMPYKRAGHNAVVANNKVYLIGGVDSAGDRRKTVLEYSEIMTNTEEVQKEQAVTIFTDEAKRLHIQQNNSDFFNLDIFNMSGLKIYSSSNSSNNLIVSLENFASGIYITKLTKKNIQQIKKISLY